MNSRPFVRNRRSIVAPAIAGVLALLSIPRASLAAAANGGRRACKPATGDTSRSRRWPSR